MYINVTLRPFNVLFKEHFTLSLPLSISQCFYMHIDSHIITDDLFSMVRLIDASHTVFWNLHCCFYLLELLIS